MASFLQLEGIVEIIEQVKGCGGGGFSIAMSDY